MKYMKTKTSTSKYETSYDYYMIINYQTVYSILIYLYNMSNVG